MKIRIQSSFHASEKLADFAEGKVGKLTQYSDRILEAEVHLKVDKSDARNNRLCDIRLVIPGNDLYASKYGASFEEAILDAADALRSQLMTWKEKTQDRSHVNANLTRSNDR